MEMISAVVLLCCLTLALGWLLLSTDVRFRRDDGDLIDAIDALLPQTQCAQCGYPGCRPYAEAVAAGAAIDLCPPGGRATFEALKALLGRSGGIAPPESDPVPARIREEECIGCFLCIRACPVDAIIGAPGFMHTVIENECTGCELCLPACPVDCIDLVAANRPYSKHSMPRATGTPTSAKGTPTPTKGTPTPTIGTRAKGTPTRDAKGTPTSAKGTSTSTKGTPTKGTPTPTKGTPAKGTPTRDAKWTLTSTEGTPTSAKGTPTFTGNTPSALQSSTAPAGTTAVEPCIGCNRCEPVCPAHLAPRELLWLSSARKWDAAAGMGLASCIECRRCDRACPSNIPLARIFGDGKRVLAESAATRARAAHARARFEARETRLAAEQRAAQARRAERLARQTQRAAGGDASC